MEIIRSKSNSGSDSKSGGSRLNRSETVTVRLDPKLNYLCELAARSQRRTKSSFIEWAVANSLGSVNLPEVTVFDEPFDEDGREASLKEKASELWHVDEPDRVAALALVAPALLNHDEQLIWKLIRENGYLWKGKHDSNGEWTWELSERTLIKDRLREKWDLFNSVARGEAELSLLPSWAKTRSFGGFGGADLDDDIPA